MNADGRYTLVESVMAGAFLAVTCSSIGAAWLVYRIESEKQHSQQSR